MFENDDELKDWEVKDEVPPKRLEDKWFKESLSFKETVACPSCKKELPRESMTCVFCGADVFYDSGLLGNILKWFKNIFKVKKP